MSAIDVVMTLTNALNAQQWEAAASSLTDDFTATGLAPITLSKQMLIAGEQAWHASSPDRRARLDQVREEDGVVKATLTVEGTQTNVLSLQNIPPVPASGKHYSASGNMTATVRGGQVASLQVVGTTPGQLEQLGIQLPQA